jgi:IclR family pca regulon transcriptional regulator
VNAFARGLDLIKYFGPERAHLTVAEAAEAVKCSRAAARRLLLTLVELGYADCQGGKFELRPKILDLGYSYLSTWRIERLVQPYLSKVVVALNENSSLGVLDGDDVVYIARSEARRIVQTISVSVGTRVPAVVSSMGRVLLAHAPRDRVADLLQRHGLPKITVHSVTSKVKFLRILDETRQTGWCLVDQEFELGLLSIAVPIYNSRGEVIAAVNVGAPTTRASANDMITRYLPVLQRQADAINSVLALRQDQAAHLASYRPAAEISHGVGAATEAL